MKLVNKGKIYNITTKGFKIDLYYDNVYHSTTDQYKTLNAAKSATLRSFNLLNPKLLKAKFKKQ